MSDYESRDYDAVARILDSFRASGLGQGFLGVFEENETLEPPPTPSADRRHPTLYVRWAIDYLDEPARTFDPESSPVREGQVLHAARIQPGSSAGWVKRLFSQLRATYSEASSESMTFLPESKSQRVGQQGPWTVYLLPIRFIATD